MTCNNAAYSIQLTHAKQTKAIKQSNGAATQIQISGRIAKAN